MTDPFDALRAPVQPADPDPIFAAQLREQLRRETLGGAMTQTTQPQDLGSPPALSPYINVADARRAIEWYVNVLGATERGEPHVNPDGTIGHAELRLGDAVLMLSEPSPLWPETPVAPPAGATHSHTLHLDVSDVDSVFERAEAAGASVERRPVDQPYGRAAAIVDPFGHRWLLLQQPGNAARARHGEIAYTTMMVSNGGRAREFYAAVLGWEFVPGSTPGGWTVRGQEDVLGLAEGQAEVQLCFRVNDLEAAVDAVRTAGGQAGDIQTTGYGRMSNCVDPLGANFQLYSP